MFQHFQQNPAQLESKSRESVAWEEAVSQGLELREQKDSSQWALGELAEKVRQEFGGQAIKQFSTSISIAHNTLREYRRVFVKIPPSDRIPHLSYRHHQLAANTETPKEWLERASDNSWSSEMLGIEIKKAQGKEVKIYPKIQECDDCGKLRIINVDEKDLCTCFVDKFKFKLPLDSSVK